MIQCPGFKHLPIYLYSPQYLHLRTRLKEYEVHSISANWLYLSLQCKNNETQIFKGQNCKLCFGEINREFGNIPDINQYNERQRTPENEGDDGHL